MIFIERSSTAIWVPKHTEGEGPYKLIIQHNMTHTERVIDGLKNEGYKSGYWIFIGLDLSDLEGGECTYRVYDKDDNELEVGLLQVMTTLKDPISYKKDKKTIIYGNK